MPALLSGTTTADALLEADLWRRVAAGYRQKLIRNFSAWRARAQRVKAERDHARERVEELENLLAEEQRAHAKTKREASKEAADKAIGDANERAGRAERSANHARKVAKDANDLADRMRSERDAARKALAEHEEKVKRETVLPALSALRVVATRLGLQRFADTENPHALAAEIDRAVLALQKRADG